MTLIRTLWYWISLSVWYKRKNYSTKSLPFKAQFCFSLALSKIDLSPFRHLWVMLTWSKNWSNFEARPKVNKSISSVKLFWIEDQAWKANLGSVSPLDEIRLASSKDKTPWKINRVASTCLNNMIKQITWAIKSVSWVS